MVDLSIVNDARLEIESTMLCVSECVFVVGRREKPPHYAAITNRRKTLVNH